MTWIDILAQSAWRGTLVLVFAFAAARLMWRGSPAWRHFLWTAALSALLILPVTTRLIPKWSVITPVAAVWQQSAPADETVVVSGGGVRRDPSQLLFWLWLAGSAASLTWFLTGRFRTWRMVRASHDAPAARALMDHLGGHRVRLRESPVAPTALTAGVIAPVVLLPASWRDWPHDRLRAVLLHEMMHVRRRDLLSQSIAQAACCLYWFHPLIWMAARRQRMERERACDDAVLRQGMPAQDYAGHLVELVRALGKRRADAVTMAEPSDLEARVRSLLDSRSDRRPLGRWAAVGIALGCVLLLVPVSAIKAYEPPHVWWVDDTPKPAVPPVDDPAPQVSTAARGTLQGTVEDPGGAVVPGCEVKAKNLDGSNEEVTRADMAGNFRFTSIPPGRYAIEVASPGFNVAKMQATVDASQSITVRARLQLGSLQESVTVSAVRPSTAPPAAASTNPRRIRVGGNVQPAKLIARIPPIYPEDLKAKGVSGTVHLRGIVTKQGYFSDLEVINTDVDTGLSAAALEAVRHWLYQPPLLNGEPVAMMTSVDVRFELVQ